MGRSFFAVLAVLFLWTVALPVDGGSPETLTSCIEKLPKESQAPGPFLGEVDDVARNVDLDLGAERTYSDVRSAAPACVGVLGAKTVSTATTLSPEGEWGNVLCAVLTGGLVFCDKLADDTRGDAISVTASRRNVRCILRISGNVDCALGEEGTPLGGYDRGDAVQVDISSGRACVVTLAGEVWCWSPASTSSDVTPARWYSGGNASKVQAPDWRVCLMTTQHGAGCMTQPEAVTWRGWTNVLDISARYDRYCYLRGNVTTGLGSVFWCSSPAWFNIERGGPAPDAVGIVTLRLRSCLLMQAGSVLCDRADDGISGTSYGSGDAVALSAGRDSFCVLKLSGSIECMPSGTLASDADHHGSYHALTPPI